MLLELWPLKATAARGVYNGSITTLDGRLGLVLAQEILLRPMPIPPEDRARFAELGKS